MRVSHRARRGVHCFWRRISILTIPVYMRSVGPGSHRGRPSSSHLYFERTRVAGVLVASVQVLHRRLRHHAPQVVVVRQILRLQRTGTNIAFYTGATVMTTGGFDSDGFPTSPGRLPMCTPSALASAVPFPPVLDGASSTGKICVQRKT